MTNRIRILGAAGSGKTTLARRMAEKLYSSWHKLDTVAYEEGYARKRTLDERLTRLPEIIIQPAWVTEGIYLWWIDGLLNKADVIVWLDLSWHIARAPDCHTTY